MSLLAVTCWGIWRFTVDPVHQEVSSCSKGVIPLHCHPVLVQAHCNSLVFIYRTYFTSWAKSDSLFYALLLFLLSRKAPWINLLLIVCYINKNVFLQKLMLEHQIKLNKAFDIWSLNVSHNWRPLMVWGPKQWLSYLLPWARSGWF